MARSLSRSERDWIEMEKRRKHRRDRKELRKGNMPSDAIRVRITLPEHYDMELQTIRRDRKQGEKVPSAESVFWEMMEGYLTRKSDRAPSRIEQFRSLRREKRLAVTARGDAILWTKWEDVKDLPFAPAVSAGADEQGTYTFRLPKDMADDLRDVGSMLRANIVTMGATPLWDDFSDFLNQAVQAEIDYAGESVRAKQRQESINELKKDDEEEEKRRKEAKDAPAKASEKKA